MILNPRLHWEEGSLVSLSQIFWPRVQFSRHGDVRGIATVRKQDPCELSASSLRPHLESHCPLLYIVGLLCLRAKQEHESARWEKVEISEANVSIEGDSHPPQRMGRRKWRKDKERDTEAHELGDVLKEEVVQGWVRNPPKGCTSKRKGMSKICGNYSKEERERANTHTPVQFITCLGLPEWLASCSRIILERKRISVNLG